MKLFAKSLFRSGMTAPLVFGGSRTFSSIQSIIVQVQGVRLDDHAKIIVTPHTENTGHGPFAVATLVEILDEHRFKLYAKNVDCEREGKMRFQWSVFNTSANPVAQEFPYFFTRALAKQQTGYKCNSQDTLWDVRFNAPVSVASDVRSLALHITNHSIFGDKLEVTAAGIVQPLSPRNWKIHGVNMEADRGNTRFSYGYFCNINASAYERKPYYLETGTTESLIFKAGQEKLWNIRFSKRFSAPPAIFVTAVRRLGIRFTAVTIPSVNAIDAGGFSFSALDTRDPNPSSTLANLSYKTKYNWIAIGE